MASLAEYEAAQEFHQIDNSEITKAFDAGWNVPWVLDKVKVLAQPVSYNSAGGVTWITINDQAINAIQVQLQ